MFTPRFLLLFAGMYKKEGQLTPGQKYLAIRYVTQVCFCYVRRMRSAERAAKRCSHFFHCIATMRVVRWECLKSHQCVVVAQIPSTGPLLSEMR